MGKKRMIIVTSIILSVVVISLGIIKLYQSYALANDIVDANSSSIIDINITENNAISVPANGYSNVFYMINNTSPGTVNYGIGYSGTDVTVKAFSASNDPASGLIEENGRKYVKLRLENSSSTSQSVVLSTILGYSGDNDLTSITPSGVTLVTEVYTPLAYYITNLYTSASKTTVTNNSIEYNYANIYDTDDDSTTSGGLMNDRLGGTTTDYDAGNIRYYGANPNNYIYFNCSDYSNQTSNTCEKWRIIGVFDGKVKIIRYAEIGKFAWDTSESTVNSGCGINEWSQADLMKLLNQGYESEAVGGSLYYNSGSGSCYNGQNNATTTCDFTSTGIKNDITRNMIEEALWNIGGWNTNDVYSNQIYCYERGTNVVVPGTTCSGAYCNDMVTRTTEWTGKIALAYPSDYGYATDFTKCSETLSSYDSSADSYVCRINDWLFVNNHNMWLLNSYSSLAHYTYRVAADGYLYNENPSLGRGIRPVLYLGSELEIESGIGTSSDPYKLSVS